MNTYIVKIEEKYFKRLINYHIYIKKIKKNNKSYLLYLDSSNYQKLLKFKKIYNIEFVGYQGVIKYLDILKRHYLFFIMSILGISLIIFLSRVIWAVDIKTEDKEMAMFLKEELNSRGIGLYKFVKSFSEKEAIKRSILEANKDKLEWLEIERVGSRYVVSLEKRIINNEENDTTPRNIVALKNAIILSIEARNGSIVKKLNDYVKKGEVIVSGEIIHKDTIVDLVKAEATIYGETWYNVHISYPIAYYEKKYTNNEKKRLSLTFLNRKFNFFDKSNYQNEEIEEIKIFSHHFLPIKLSYEKVLEVKIEDNLYTTEEATLKALEVAREKLLKSLDSDAKILAQKKLKIIINNSTIDMDVFFKVYENITDTKLIDKSKLGLKVGDEDD